MSREQKEELFKLQTKDFTSYHNKRQKNSKKARRVRLLASPRTRYNSGSVLDMTLPLILTKERTVNYANFSHRAIIIIIKKMV